MRIFKSSWLLVIGLVVGSAGVLVAATSGGVTKFLSSRTLLDKIVARVNGQNILHSDLKAPRIDKDGEPYSLKDAIDQKLLLQKASERKLMPTNLEVEKYIVAWKEMHHLMNMTEEQFEERLKSDGLTSKQYRNQLFQILAVRNLRQLEVSERIVITSREVEEYHKSNPAYSEDRFLIKTKIVPFDKAASPEEAPKVKGIDWIELDMINRSELAEHMSFVADMKASEGKIVKVEHGYQLIKLVKKDPKHLMDIDERWVEIEKAIQQERMKKFEKEYLDELKKKASIVYLD